MATNNKLFLSFSGHDRDCARGVFQLLKAAGFEDVFFDEDGMEAGGWSNQIQAKLSDGRRLVLLVTPHAMRNGRVLDELETLQGDDEHWQIAGRVVPVMLVPAPLPPILKSTHYVQGSWEDGSLWSKLLTTLECENPPATGVEIPAPGESLEPKLYDRYKQLVARLLPQEYHRLALASALSVRPEELITKQPTPELAANSALFASSGADPLEAGALRVLRAMASKGMVGTDADRQECDGLIEDLEHALPDGADKVLSAYLAHVVKRNKNLLEYLGRADATDLLKEVYVQLDLRPDSIPHRDKSEIHAPRTLEKLLALDPKENSWVTRRWVLRGDPGTGKTTLLRHFARRLADTSFEEKRWTPLYTTIRDLLKGVGSPEQKLEALLTKADPVYVGLGRRFAEEEKAGRLLLLLDGLDEVQAEEQGDAIDAIQALAHTRPEATIVVATRTIGYTPIDRDVFIELELQPLAADRKREFLQAWFAHSPRAENRDAAPERTEETIVTLNGNPSLLRLSDCPLYLTLIAMLIEDGKTPDSQRHQLFEQIFDHLLDGKHREGDPIALREDVYTALRRLAHELTEADDLTKPASRLELLLADQEGPHLRRIRAQWPALRSFLEAESKQVGILGEHDGQERPWRWWHKSFREALTAERFSEMSEDDLLARAAQIGTDAGRWGEPFALFVGRSKEPDRWLRRLHDENPNLALRALASVDVVGEDTLFDLLALDRSDLDRRCATYLELLTKVGDAPEVAVGLLRRLAERATGQSEVDTQELWHLDEALRRIEQTGNADDLHKEIEAVRAQILSPFGSPMTGTEVDALEVPGQPGHKFWRRVPKGTEAWIGSEENDEQGYPDERPRHRVVIARSFEIAAIPVTRELYARFKPGNLLDNEAHPMTDVSFYDAALFCRWLGARLPSEAEWETACRAGTDSQYWSGNTEADLTNVGWFASNTDGGTKPVARKAANSWGLYDVHGNVWEVCQDTWHENYEGAPTDGSAWDEGSGARVLRGGSWLHSAGSGRSAYRGRWHPGLRSGDVGFRPARFVTE